MKSLLIALSILFSAQVMALEIGDTVVDVTVTQYQATGGHLEVGTTEMDEGHEFVLVEFFAFWCYYCHESKPVVKKLSNSYKDILTVRAITNEPITDFSILSSMAALQGEEPLLNIASDTGETLPALTTYGIQGFPTFFLVNKDGVIVHKHVGLLTDQSATPFHNIILGL